MGDAPSPRKLDAALFQISLQQFASRYKYILLLLCFSALLVATNPNDEDFETFVQDQIIENWSNDLVVTFSGPISSIISEASTRREFYLFSFYSVDLTPLAFLGKKLPPRLKFLGFANTFIQLNHENFRSQLKK